MDQNEVAALLKRRSAYNSQPYGPDVIDAWAEALADVDAFAANRALLAAHLASPNGAVSVKQLRDHLPKRPLDPTPPLEPFEPVLIDPVRLLVTAGIAQGRAERLRQAQARDDGGLLARRIEWWRNGGVGHVPDCDRTAFEREPPRIHRRSRTFSLVGIDAGAS